MTADLDRGRSPPGVAPPQTIRVPLRLAGTRAPGYLRRQGDPASQRDGPAGRQEPTPIHQSAPAEVRRSATQATHGHGPPQVDRRALHSQAKTRQSQQVVKVTLWVGASR